jgi:hypothetical protein
MIIGALIALLFLGGSGASLMTGSLERLDEQLKAVVADQATLEKALAVSDNIAKVDKEWATKDAEQEEALGKMMADYESDPRQMTALLKQIQLDRGDFEDALIAARSELKEILSREEWAEVFSRESE